MNAFQIYCLLKLDAVSCLFGVLGILMLIYVGAVILFCGVFADENKIDFSEYYNTRTKKAKPVLIGILGSIILLIGILMPSTKEMATIIIVPKIINNEEIQKIPNKMIDLANEWLDELKPNKAEKVEKE